MKHIFGKANRSLRLAQAEWNIESGGNDEVWNRCAQSFFKNNNDRIPYFDTCPPQEDSLFLAYSPPQEDSIFDIYPPLEDLLFQSFGWIKLAVFWPEASLI